MTDDLNPRLLRNLRLIEEAARAGERCPLYQPRGPLDPNVVTDLFERGYIRSEIYSYRFRRIVLLKGDHAGAATASHPSETVPIMVNGRRLLRSCNKIPSYLTGWTSEGAT